MRILCIIPIFSVLFLRYTEQHQFENENYLQKDAAIKDQIDFKIIAKILEKNRELEIRIDELTTTVNELVKKDTEEHQVDDYCHKSYCDILDDRINDEIIVRTEEHAEIEEMIKKESMDRNSNVTMLSDQIADEVNTRKMEDNMIKADLQELRTIVEDIDSFNNTPRFVAYSMGSSTHPPIGAITFEVEQIDNYGNFEETTGIFRPKKDGIYWFIFNCFVYRSPPIAMIDIYVNGVEYQRFLDYDNNEDDGENSRQFTFTFSVELKANDELYLRNGYSNSIYHDDDQPMTIMGFMFS